MNKQTPSGFVATESQTRHEKVDILKQTGDRSESLLDTISVEEPLEIRIAGSEFVETTLAITMRTPGCDHELSLGFLFAEGIIASLDDVSALDHCSPPSPEKGLHNSISVLLATGTTFRPEQLDRHFYTSSSCGVCGKTSIENVIKKNLSAISHHFSIKKERLTALPGELHQKQADFSRTGGIHAAGLINPAGNLLTVREDIGRHNAVDKLIGTSLLAGGLPLSGHGLMLSGRASFELVQKAIMAGIEFVAAIGPPSSLSIELARGAGMTLAGFISDKGFNLYSHPGRVS